MYAAQIKEVIEAEHFKTGKAWVELSRLSQLLYDIHRLTVTENFFVGNAEFRIYRTSNPNEIYISLPTEVSLLTAAKRTISLTNNVNSQETSRSRLQGLSDIKSCEDIEEALHQILHHLTYRYPNTFIDIQTIEVGFYSLYGRSLESVVSELISDFTPVEFLKCSNRFLTVQAENFWKVAIAPPNPPQL
ncbi:hypothetical protein [Phormidesmis priestleyi]